MSVGYMDCGHFLMQSINEHKPIECIYFAMGILCLNQVLKTVRIVVKNICNILKYFLDSFIYLYLSLCKSTYVCGCSLRSERTLNPLDLKLQLEEGMGSPRAWVTGRRGHGLPRSWSCDCEKLSTKFQFSKRQASALTAEPIHSPQDSSYANAN